MLPAKFRVLFAVSPGLKIHVVIEHDVMPIHDMNLDSTVIRVDFSAVVRERRRVSLGNDGLNFIP